MHRGGQGATSLELMQALNPGNLQSLNLATAMCDIRKRALVDLGARLLPARAEPKVAGRRVYRYFLERVSAAPAPPPPAQPAEVATPAPQASRSDDHSDAAALGRLFDDRPIYPS